MSMPPLTALHPVRHHCEGCGGCCEGSIVHLIDDHERERLLAQAATLGVATPLGPDGTLAREGGRCVFLQADQGCMIHARFGGDQKPLICRQFPLVLIETEQGRRVGIDPGTTSLWQADLHGEPLEPTPEMPFRSAPLPPELARLEGVLVSICEHPQATIGTLAHALCGLPAPAAAGLPEGLAARVGTLLRASQIPTLVQRIPLGATQRTALRPIVSGIEALGDDPVWTPLDPRLDAYSRRVLGALLWLRLASKLPSPQATAWGMLVGVIANAWFQEGPARFGAGVAVWSRVLRSPQFFGALLPEPALLPWLAGQGPKPASIP